ncbi:MAG: DNA adenine methylase, partial [Clostridia bacterium]|nr:DNA adenine methylase [Clostridia bacterium]
MDSEKIYVPPIKIQGIKTRIVPIIKKNIAIDENMVWIEPFMGSGVVGFNVVPRKALFFDINPCIIDFYNEIK